MTPDRSNLLPADVDDALLVGRAWRSAPVDGPAVVTLRRGLVPA